MMKIMMTMKMRKKGDIIFFIRMILYKDSNPPKRGLKFKLREGGRENSLGNANEMKNKKKSNRDGEN